MSEPQSQNPPVFDISLCMAGAISAGAYTAGVVDFLIEALEEWETVRGEPGVPTHRVVLRGFAGASAGGIVGALGAAALSGDNRPSPKVPTPPDWVRVPRLYQAWVTGPDMLPTPAQGSAGARPGLLGLDDLAGVTSLNAVKSLLNGKVLDGIRDHCFDALGTSTPKPYIAQDFHAYLTISNLRGVPYQINFPGTSEIYGMQNHGDRGHYIITGLGSALRPRVMAALDAALNLDSQAVPAPWSYPAHGPRPAPDTWYSFADTTLSTAAFPAGLPPREIAVSLPSYDGRLFAALDMETRVVDSGKLQPAWTNPDFKPSAWGSISPRPIINVDGGMIDNDPFEYARMALVKERLVEEGGQLAWQANPRDEHEADSAVLMIMPFPEPPAFQPDDAELNPTLLYAVTRLFGTLVNQTRFKPVELIAAADEKIFSRFLISPSREGPNGEMFAGADAIACGLLGGFGGFMDEAFRAHDYQLGRRNCQRFLQEVFLLHKNNAVVRDWAAGLTPTPGAAHVAQDGATDDPVIARIIPLYGRAAIEVPAPVWPKLSEKKVALLTQGVENRAAALVPLVIKEASPSLGWLGSVLRGLLWLPFVSGLIVGKIAGALATAFQSTLNKQLVARKQK